MLARFALFLALFVSHYLHGLDDVVFLHNPRQLRNIPHPNEAKAVHQLIKRMLLDTENLRRFARQFADQDSGHPVVATTCRK